MASREACVGNSRTVAATMTGAVIGGLAGYIFFTERGRALRRSIEPALDDLRHELVQFRGTMQKLVSVTNETWDMLSDALGAVGRQPRRIATTHQTTHQTSPF